MACAYRQCLRCTARDMIIVCFSRDIHLGKYFADIQREGSAQGKKFVLQLQSEQSAGAANLRPPPLDNTNEDEGKDD